jgi:hypothetical protein
MDSSLEKDFQNIHSLLNALIVKMVDSHGPEAVAAILMINSISIYNTCLDEATYKDVIKNMYKEALRFAKADARVLH